MGRYCVGRGAVRVSRSGEAEVVPGLSPSLFSEAVFAGVNWFRSEDSDIWTHRKPQILATIRRPIKKNRKKEERKAGKRATGCARVDAVAKRKQANRERRMPGHLPEVWRGSRASRRASPVMFSASTSTNMNPVAAAISHHAPRQKSDWPFEIIRPQLGSNFTPRPR